MTNTFQMSDKKHIVQFSGGACSYMAAKRVISRQGKGNVILLFADTGIEDPSLYALLNKIPEAIGVRVTIIKDGRTPWQVFNDNRMIANTQADICSRVLKRELLDKWILDNGGVDPHVYFGIDWTEEHRYHRLKNRKPYKCFAPMCEQPLMSKDKMLEEMRADGLPEQTLYKLGFPHNNCGGFCIKAGQAHFALLLRTMPGRYAHHEEQEKKIREKIGDYSVLRDRSGGTTKPLTLEQLRKRIQAQLEFDTTEWGGCGCAVE